EFVYTRGEAWVHDQVRRLDPGIFARIREFADAGRWCIVNGWWVQPDCNLPTREALLQSGRMGHTWFRDHLGVERIPVGYNVDSFGHGACLPGVLAELGQPYYVMMRPGPGEKTLPDPLFRWRSPLDGAEALVYRIAGWYNACAVGVPEAGCTVAGNIDLLRRTLPADTEHAMCFYGVGNHGGGPTRAMVEWIRDHRELDDGVTLAFSTPERYFAAVEDLRPALPVVEDELQYHAVGCYSVCGDLKRAVRAAELAAAAAEALLDRAGAGAPPDARIRLDDAWRSITFNQFHDILPGSSIPPAMDAAEREAGCACTTVDAVTHEVLRLGWGLPSRAQGGGHRIHAVHAGSEPWEGLVEFEAWTDWQGWGLRRIETADGTAVPFQRVLPASISPDTGRLDSLPRLRFPLALEPGEHRLLFVRMAETDAESDAPPNARLDGDVFAGARLAVQLGPDGVAGIRTAAADGTDNSPGQELAGPLRLLALRDTSDTWSHRIDRYEEPVEAAGVFGPPVPVEAGPLASTVRLDGRIGTSPVQIFVSLERDEPVVRLRLRGIWLERFTVLKAALALANPATTRRDRVAGGWIGRDLDGRERPCHHATLLTGSGGATGVAFPDAFALDADAAGPRVTLLRNSVHALHNSNGRSLWSLPELANRPGTDEGAFDLRLDLLFGDAATEAGLDRQVARALRPPHLWDDYAGVSRVAHME
ncbi:MAG: hypothetical protein ACOCX4_01935, partial [Planctomycetota bacterium]